jgi:hypothetical protein
VADFIGIVAYDVGIFYRGWRAFPAVISKRRSSAGESAYNQDTILVMLNFSRTDLDEPEDGIH